MKFRWLTGAAVALCVATGSASTASAAQPDCTGRGVPDSKISIQLWTFAEYIGFGTDAATIERTETVFAELREMGYRNVEPFTLSGLSAEAYRDLLDEYGLKASARHVDVGTPQNGDRLRPGSGRQQGARDPLLRLRLHPDLPADLHDRGGVGRVRRVPECARGAGTAGRPDAVRAQP